VKIPTKQILFEKKEKKKNENMNETCQNNGFDKVFFSKDSNLSSNNLALIVLFC